MSKHFEDCSAPICQEMDSDNVVWYPGEEVCLKKPYNKVQKKQLLINRELSRGTFRHSDTPLTGLDLKNRSQ